MSLASELTTKPDHGPIDGRRLAAILQETYEKKRRSGHVQKRTFSPSGIGYGHGKCPRYWFIAFNGAEWEEDTDALSIAIMENGTYTHDRIAKLFKESPLNISAIEKEALNEDPPIRGFIDVIVDRSGEDVIGEVKSTRTEAFIHRQSKMDAPDYHMVQLLLYMYIEEAEHGFFLYENKNTQELLVVPINRSDHEELLQSVLEWMRQTYKAYEGDVIPKPAFRKGSKVCQACPFERTCWDELPEGSGDIGRLQLA